MKWRALNIKLTDPRRQLDDIVCSKESPVRLIHRSIVHCVQSSIRRTRFYKYQIDSVLICLIVFNPLNPELNPICYLLALLGAHHFLHVSRIRVKLLTFR